MIDLNIIILFSTAILGMLSAFYLGTRKYQDGVFESSKKYEIEEPESEITDEEYHEFLNTRKYYESEQDTG